MRGEAFLFIAKKERERAGVARDGAVVLATAG